MPFYAVAKGQNQGIYKSWGDCEQQVKGFSGARYKKFDTAESAQQFINSQGGCPSTAPKTESTFRTNYTTTNYNLGTTACNKNYSNNNEGYAQVYTDGACSSNGRAGARAGLGVYWGEDHPLNTSEPVTGRATNNSGEIQAASRAMKQALDRGITKLAINTDSKFLIDSATKWMPNWKENGWKLQSGEPVKNQTDFKELDALQQKLDVKWNYVEAHRGVHGNEMADQFAKAGASKYND